MKCLLNEMSLTEMSLNETSSIKMTSNKMSLNKMSLNEMSYLATEVSSLQCRLETSQPRRRKTRRRRRRRASSRRRWSDDSTSLLLSSVTMEPFCRRYFGVEVLFIDVILSIYFVTVFFSFFPCVKKVLSMLFSVCPCVM